MAEQSTTATGRGSILARIKYLNGLQIVGPDLGVCACEIPTKQDLFVACLTILFKE